MTPAISLVLLVALAAAESDPLVRGLESFRNGEYAAAERELREALKGGGDERAAAFLALTQAATGRCEQAGGALAKAFQGAGGEVERLAGLALAQCHIASNRFEDAAAVVAKLKSKHPSDPDVLYQEARLHMRAWNDTIYRLYQKAPASFRVNQISGEILETQGQFAEAAAEYRKAIEKSPRALSLHFRLGRALLMSSHAPQTLEAALKEFEAEIALNPLDSIAHFQVAQVLLVQQKQRDATARFERALELNADFPEALIALGKLWLEEAKNDEAIGLLQRAAKLQPRSEAAHYNLMMAYRNAGRLDEARREKAEIDKLQRVPEGEFSEFLKKLGEKPPAQR